MIKTGCGLRAAGYGRFVTQTSDWSGHGPRRWAALVLALALAAPAAVVAQDVPAAPAVPAPPPVSAAPATPDAPAAPAAPDVDWQATSWRRPIVRVGQDSHVRAGDRVREVVTVMGSARIDGHVDRDVVVVLGTLHLGPSAVIDGNVVTVAGGTIVEPGARVGRDFVSVAGAVDAPSEFLPGRDYTIVGLPGMADNLQETVPWFTRGLLWGRLIVPSLGWMWIVVAVAVGVYFVLNLLFDRPVRACRDVIAERPFSALLVGLLVLVLIGPVFFILAVSVIGIPVIPFLLCGLVVAALLGKIGLTRWIGHTMIPETDDDNRLESIRSFLIGTAVILFAYMVPILGVLVWAFGSVFGLGAATLAFSSGLRRESPRREGPDGVAPLPPSSPLTPAPPVAPVSTYGAEPLRASTDEFPSEAAPDPAAFVPPAAPARPPSVPAGVSSADTLRLLAMPKAPFLDRLAAFAIDVLLVSLTFSLLDLHGARGFFTLLLGYHILFWALKATTVGGIICNLRIVRTDGGQFTFPDALIRGLSSILSIAALGIGCLWILYDPDNQSWHDRFAGTYVVKVPKGWPV